MRRISLFTWVLGIALLGAGMTSCKKEEGCTDPNASNYNADAELDDGSCEYENSEDSKMEVPSTYEFDHVDYSGQTARIELLDMLAKKISEAENGNKVTEQELLDIFNNNGAISGTSKNLADKVFPDDKSMYLDWFKEVDSLSGDMDNVVDGRFVNNDSIELNQVVEKGLMGACFYYQAMEVYLTDLELDDNETVTEGKGTEMAHHFDEAFGYFGAPVDFSASSPAEVGNSYTDEAWFWGKYCIGRNDALGNLNTIFDAFLEGRTAIVNDESSKRKEAVTTIKEEWEKVCAANLAHYLKSTRDDIENGAADGDKYHHWSEAYGFYLSLQYNSEKIISDADWQSIGNDLGDKPADTDKSKLDNALTTLQNAYGFTNGEMSNF